jgi:lipopolysaccharide/colanic/teichoic acid biosynthesis glycosyltransferase
MHNLGERRHTACSSRWPQATPRASRSYRGRGCPRVAIVGASAFGVEIAEQLQAAKGEGLDVVGFLDEYLPLGQPLVDDAVVIGRPSDLLKETSAGFADEYILVPQALPHQRQEEITRLMLTRSQPVLHMAISSSDLMTHGVQMLERGSVPLVRVERARLRGVDLMLKTALDRGFALVALLLLAPFAALALVRCWISSDSSPILHGYQICGSGGEQCTLWLFSARVTGWLPLRGLPALLAVLLGHFSLVGPRPVICDQVNLELAPVWLTAVKPGLTGPWRLSGPGASLEQQAILDLAYIRNYTIWEDLRILLESMRRLRLRSLRSLLVRWEESTECDSGS